MRLRRAWAFMAVAALAIAGAAQAQEATMTPKVVIKGDGVFQCYSAPYLFATKAAVKESAALQPVLDEVDKLFGGKAAFITDGRSLPKSPFLLAGLPDERPMLRDLLARVRPQLPKEGLGEEGYAVEITTQHILLTAAKPAGFYRGAMALVEMAESAANGQGIPAGTYADWPAMAWRGMHVMVGGKGSIPALEMIISQYGPALRINKLIVEVDYGFAFKSHPEMADPNGLTVADCKRLTELARSHYMELIPQVNCLGHQSWDKYTGKLLTAHPEFDETPDLAKDNPGIYCRSWCPSNPDVAKFAGDLIDEVIDAFDAKWFHCGMDEVFILGKCPRCKGKPNSELFAKAVNDLHAHLAKRKVGMMMWGDRFLDGKATGYGEWEASENDTAPAIKLVPKDIVLCDWHYGKQQDFPSVKLLQDAGFRVWPSGWNSVDNGKGLAACALRNDGKNMAGYMATTWVGIEQLVHGLAGDPTALSGDSGRELVPGIRAGLALAWQGK